MTAWNWVFVGLAVWLTIQFPLAHLVGRRIRNVNAARIHRPPAGGKAAIPRAAKTAICPGAVPPAGPHGPVIKRFDLIACGNPDGYCAVVYDSRDRSTVPVYCPLHNFDVAEWNARLRQ